MVAMAGRRKQKPSYVPDPERRHYLAEVRKIREQVLRENEKALGEASFWKRLALRFRIEGEIRRRSKAIPRPGPEK